MKTTVWWEEEGNVTSHVSLPCVTQRCCYSDLYLAFAVCVYIVNLCRVSHKRSWAVAKIQLALEKE